MGTATRVLLLALSVGPSTGAAGDEPWHLVAERNGVTLEKRAVAESRYYEYRARCYGEPGGSIPAFLVRGAQQSQVLDEFERALSRVGR